MNGILADEMGLGKTVQIIALICYLIEKNINGPYLIITPLSTIPNWRDEFKRFAPKIPVVTFHGDKNVRKSLIEKIQKYYRFDNKNILPVVLTTYTGILLDEYVFSRTAWKYIIIDEGQRIKNYKSKLHR